MKIVGLEEHFVIPDVLHAWQSLAPRWQDLAVKPSSEGDAGRRLMEFGPERIAAMDDEGIDVQVLSLTSPGVQSVAADQAVELARLSNDRVAEAVRSRPDRFQGFATLPTPAPHAAARELERAVRELGLQGAMVFGRTRDRNLDHPDFWPILEAAAALKAPLYMHPQSPQNGVIDAYYSGFGEEVDSLFARSGLGWHYEAGIQIVRMILAGVFDRFPDLQIITGHWGELMLFYLERLDLMAKVTKLPRKISEYFLQHVFVTSSGMFSQRYLRWAVEVIGVDHILMGTDYPFVMSAHGGARAFLQDAALNDEEREKIASGNWERLCAGIRR